MGTSILDLPTEILDLILQTLSSTEFRALCQVSRSFNHIAEPRLYSKIDWTWHFGWDRLLKPGFPINLDIPPIVQFLCTITHRPSLAAFIETIKLRGDNLTRIPHHFRGRHPCISVPGFDSNEFDILLDCSGVTNHEQWIQELRRGSMDAFVALLLAHAPNLKSLSIDENFLRDGALTAMVLRSSALRNAASASVFPFPSAGFARLEQVRLNLSNDWRHRQDSHNTVNTLSLFYLPAARHLAVSIDNPAVFSWPASSPPRATILTSLDLGMLSADHLGRILSVTKNLRSLRWEWLACTRGADASVLDSINDPIVLDLDTIMAALWMTRTSLTDLSITTRFYYGGHQYIDQPDVVVKGSLHPLSTGFPMLTKLEVPLIFLTRSNRMGQTQAIAPSLPREVEVLNITAYDVSLEEDWDESPIDVIESWLSNRPISTPRLRQFHFQCSDDIVEGMACYSLEFEESGRED